MEELFRRIFDGSIFTLDQPFIFSFAGKNLLATIKAINLMELLAMEKGGSAGRQGVSRLMKSLGLPETFDAQVGWELLLALKQR
jgi:hypothetical protein